MGGISEASTLLNMAQMRVGSVDTLLWALVAFWCGSSSGVHLSHDVIKRKVCVWRGWRLMTGNRAYLLRQLQLVDAAEASLQPAPSTEEMMMRG
jgi:hypothetical protein